MFLKNRMLIIGGSMMTALLLGFSWVSTALATSGVGDGDAPDGDELMWPLLLIAGLIIIGIITYFVVQRRSRSQSQEH